MSHHRPWGPHGPEGSPLEVKPNPTPTGSFQNIGGGEEPSAGGGGGGGGVTHPVTQVFFSIVMVPFVWPFWTCLYPLTAAAGVGAGLLAASLGARLLAPEDHDVAAAFAILLGFAVIVAVSRVEYRLAQDAMFRKVRHVLRLFLLGVFIAPWFVGFMGDAEARRASFGYLLGLLTHPLFLLRQLTNPVSLAVAGGVALVMHFLLTKATRLREFWHWRLMWIGLK